MPASTLASVGLGWTSAKTPGSSLAARRLSIAAAVMGSASRPWLVTKSGREIPAAAQASASSTMRPAPKRIAVGKDQLTEGGIQSFRK